MTETSSHMQSDAEMFDRVMAANGRSCGSCSLCCRLLDVPEIGKPKHGWCQHCRPGKGGCSIYDQRPQVCRDYACGWLSGHLSHDYWFPPKAKMIVDTHRDKGTGVYTVRILVDPRHPDRWREQPYYSDIKQIALTALRNGFAQGRVTQTVIVIGDKWTKIVMPHRQVDYGPGIVLPPLEDGPGLDRFEFVPCKDSEAVKELDTKMKTFIAAGRRARRDFPNAPMEEILALAAQAAMRNEERGR